MDKITESFTQALVENGASKLTIKNYLSDINNFTSWLKTSIRKTGAEPQDLQSCIPFLTHSTLTEYKHHLSQNVSANTLNRRLSSLRKLAAFLYDTSLLDYDFSEQVHNLTSVKAVNNSIESFEKYLISQNVSKNTLKNYMSDLKQFDAWMRSDKYKVN